MKRTYEYFTFKIKKEQLQEYYEKNGLTIIGLNDSQGINTTALFKKGLLEFFADMLTTENTDTKVINAFSLMFNKTEHINYLLRSNPNLEEIKDLQVYGMVDALKKAMKDFHLPSFAGNIGYVSKILYKKKENDKDIRLTDTLKNSKEPIVIYSSGANDIMREGWNNPFSIVKDYKKQNNAYKYALDKLSDVSTVKRVIDGVEGNINNILSLNDKADIFTLGLYIPKSMQNEAMEVFNDAILRYNEFLRIICDKYNINYVDTENIAYENNNSKLNFYVSTKSHKEIAEYILEKLYNTKIYYKNQNKENELPELNNFKNGKYGLYEILIDLKHDLNNVEIDKFNNKREKEIAIEKSQEIERQIEVIKKTLIKKM